MNRRSLLRNVAFAGAAFGLEGLVARGALAKKDKTRGYGPLAPRKAENTNEVFLALPEGFKYNVFGRTGDLLLGGKPTPPAHDGMAAFDVGGKIRLVRNHEVRSNAAAIGDPALAYDLRAGGGTTTLVIDPVTRLPEYGFISLGGSHTNCAGGPTPWGTWITCEETTQRVTQTPPRRTATRSRTGTCSRCLRTLKVRCRRCP